MQISFSQPYDIVCPACQSPFTADAWVIVDASERPDLAARVADGTLHDTRCPRCGQLGVVAAPLLYHDRALRAVLFGVPPEMAEAEWQELAQGLLWMLIGALPRELQLPYLGNVQAEDGVTGVAHALQHVRPMPQTAAEALGDALGSDDPDELPPLAEAIMRLLDANGPEDFQTVLALYPFLLDEAMDEGLAGLAEAAVEQGEIGIGQAFERARIVLGQLRGTLDTIAAKATAPMPQAESELLDEPPPAWRAAVKALLHAEDAEELAKARAAHPELADPRADSWLKADEAMLRSVGDLAGAQLVAEARALLRGERG